MTRPRLPRRPHPTASRDRTASLITLQPLPTTMSYANLKGFPPRPFADQRKVFSVVLSGPPWLKRCSSWSFVDKKVFFATLRAPSRIKERCSPRPSASSADKKGVLRGPSWTKRCSSRLFAPLRGQKGVLRDPSRPFADQRKVFSASLRVLRGQKRCSSRPFVDKKVFFATLRAPSRIKERCSPRPSASSADKKGVLRGPSWTKRCPPWSSVALRG